MERKVLRIFGIIYALFVLVLILGYIAKFVLNDPEFIRWITIGYLIFLILSLFLVFAGLFYTLKN